MLAFVLGALCLGVYGAYSAPGLSIGAPALAAVFGLPDAVVPGRAGSAVVVVSAVVLLLLLSATVLALRGVLGRAWGEASTALTEPTVAFLVVAASIGSLWPGDASRALLVGLGLTASSAAPLAWVVVRAETVRRERRALQ